MITLSKNWPYLTWGSKKHNTRTSYNLLLDKLEVDGFVEVIASKSIGLVSAHEYSVVHNPSEIETIVTVNYGDFQLEYIFDFMGVQHYVLLN